MNNTYHFKYRVLAEALYEALKPDPYYYTLEKSVEGSQEDKNEAMLRYYDFSMRESELYGQLYQPSNHNVGASIWSTPLSEKIRAKKKSQKTEFLKNYLGQKSLDTYSCIIQNMSEKSEGLVNNNAWYLSIVGIRPSYQNQGLGIGLIKPILEMADQQGVSTYLETFTPRNINFYERLGYSSIGSFHEPITNSTYWLMLRPSK